MFNHYQSQLIVLIQGRSYTNHITHNTNVILSKLFIVPITIKLDKIDTDLSRHCNSPSALLQLTEQHLYIELYCQKSTKNVCVLLRSKLNGDAQQYTTNLFFFNEMD